MKLIDHTNPALREVAQPFDFKMPPFDPIQFAHDLIKFLYDSGGVTISAPQVGIPYRIFAMRGAPENFVCFNPRIVQPSDEQIRLEETSLTYPGLEIKVKRPRHCRVRFATPNSEVQTETYTGMTARVFQQSVDFLNGRLFYEGANRVHREQALRKWRRSN